MTSTNPTSIALRALEIGDTIEHDSTAFQLTNIVGAGAMGTVFKGRITGTDEPVAIKILHAPRHWQRALQEGRILLGLHHEHIVKARAVFARPNGDEVEVVLILDFAESDLERLSENGLLTVHCAFAVLRQVLLALAYAHAEGVVHRDVKMSNIALHRAAGRCQVKLFDFGIAKLRDSGLHLTATSETVGTPTHMAPEQLYGSKSIDGRADLYAVGVVTHELLTGRLPFQADESVAVRVMHLTRPPPTLAARLPEAFRGAWLDQLDRVVSRALAKSPDERFADAGAMLGALDEVIALFQEGREPTSAPLYCLRRDDLHATTITPTRS